MKLTDRYITKYTINSNTTAPGDRSHSCALVVQIQRSGANPDRWYLTNAGMVYNHRSGDWDIDSAFRHADDKAPYLTSLGEAARRIDAVIKNLHEEHSST